MRFFRKIFLFQGLPDRSLAVMVHTMMEKTYAEGETIFGEGEVGRAFFVVADGKVQLFHSNKDSGQADPITELGPGGFFGEMALLDELPRSASARTLEPTTLYILYKSSFDSLIADAPHVASKVLHTLARLLSARLRRENFQASMPTSASKTKSSVLGAFAKKLFR